MTREELCTALTEDCALISTGVLKEAAAMLEQDGALIAHIAKSDTLKYQEFQALAAKVARLREALEGLLWYTDQLEMLAYSSDDTGIHEQVAAARAALGETA